MPVLVFLFLECLDPIVGNTHGHTVIETDTAVLDGYRKTGHSAHFFRDGDGRGVDLMDELVGKGEICDGVDVLVAVVVVGVRAEILTESVVIIEHRSDAVEAEAVEAILLEPVFAVGEQEVEHFVLSVVEAERIPCGVLTPAVAIKIEVVAAVESSKPLDFVFDGVAVDYVHDHGNAELVGAVDERFEIVGGAEAA